jgi:hypothetical protein
MKYAVEVGSGAMICVQILIKIASGIQKLVGEINREQGDCISPLLLLQNKESRVKNIPLIETN